MAEEIVRFNEDILGNPEFDQKIELEEKDEDGNVVKDHLYISRPFSSLYEFEKGIVNLAFCYHVGYQIDELDPEQPDYREIYR